MNHQERDYLNSIIAERDELERLRKPLIVALAQAEAEVARLRGYADRMMVQVDELTEERVERNAENKRLREALTEIADGNWAGWASNTPARLARAALAPSATGGDS